MFQKLDSAIKEFEDEGGSVIKEHLYENGTVKRRTVIVVTKHGGIHILQSHLMLESEEFNSVFLNGELHDFLRDEI